MFEFLQRGLRLVFLSSSPSPEGLRSGNSSSCTILIAQLGFECIDKRKILTSFTLWGCEPVFACDMAALAAKRLLLLSLLSIHNKRQKRKIDVSVMAKGKNKYKKGQSAFGS